MRRKRARGGVYATISGRTGVFVLSQSAFDELHEPHVDRNVVEIDRNDVETIELIRRNDRGAPERFALRREHGLWRTAEGAPADRANVGLLLDQLTLVRAPRVGGYGPPGREHEIGAMQVSLSLAQPSSSANGDAGSGVAATRSRVVVLRIGALFGSGPDSGYWARRDGIDATLSVPRSVGEALRAFRP